MKQILTILSFILVLSGCARFHRQHQPGVVVQLGQQVLYQEDIDHITAGTTGEDSAAIADAYIQQWAEDILVYQDARDQAQPQLEALVEDYRRSLYVHEYEQRLITRHMSTEVEDSVISAYYQRHAKDLELHETIIKGILLVIPSPAPNMNKLQKWLSHYDDKDNLEKIEKYAYQYAKGYELFDDNWQTANQLLLHLPMEPEDLQSQLKKQTQIIAKDSSTTYILQVTDKRMNGDTMPQDYAQDEIKQLILTQRQVPFLKQMRHRLYEEALLFGKLKIYEKE